jgi:hypothetical protein
LPLDIRVFFGTNRAFLLQHVTDPLDTAKAPAERNVIFIWTVTAASVPSRPQLQGSRGQVRKIKAQSTGAA